MNTMEAGKAGVMMVCKDTKLARLIKHLDRVALRPTSDDLAFSLCNSQKSAKIKKN
jgi:hypothetical protein